MRTIKIKKANKWFLSFLLLFGTFLPLNAQVQDSLTINTGIVASAIGLETQALGDYSFAAGHGSIAKLRESFAIGLNAYADGLKAFSIGENSYSASQGYSFGISAKANGTQSFAFGKAVEANAGGAITIGSSLIGQPLINNKSNSLMVGFNSTIPTFFIGTSPTLYSAGNVGIATTNPVARLQVADGDIFIQDIDKGIILKSPDGSCWRGTMNNSGQLEFVKLTDCENLTAKSNEGTEIKLIKVFPNPSKEYFEVKCSKADCQKYNTISIFGTTGNLVFSQPFNSEITRISTSSLKPGSYVLKLHGGQESFTDILIITH